MLFDHAPLAVLAFSLAACGSAPTESLGEARQSITSGTPDDADGSAVLVIAKSNGTTGYCSGVIVAPHVVLTAAHCATGNYEYSIFLGADYADPVAKARAESFVAVKEHHGHPEWSTASADVNDIGVLITAAPMSQTPAAINRRALGANDKGRAIRIVGYGRTGGDATMGRRNVATTTIAGLDDTTLEMDGLPNICLFDSGGPTFSKQDGVDVVVGIHVVVSSTDCNGQGYDTRVDRYADFVDQYIGAADPPVDAGAPGSDAAIGDGDAGSTDAGTPAAPPSSSCAFATSRPSSAVAALSALLVACARRRRRAR